MSQIYVSRITTITDHPQQINDLIPVNVLSWHEKDTKYYELSPYFLRTDGNEEQYNKGNVLFENFWQGSKVYEIMYPIEVYCHPSKKGNRQYLWYENTLKQIHINSKNEITDEYYTYRNNLFDCKHPIRYPNGSKRTKECKFALLNRIDGTCERYDYISSRINIYYKEYVRLIRQTSI